MWHRPVVALAMSLLFVIPLSAQVSSVYSRAVPPDKAVIERVNLKTEWTINLPIDGRKDSISLIQTLDDQLIVQTRTGRIISIDALTGRVQWAAQLGNGGYVNTFPAAVNGQYLFVSNVTTMYSFHRYSGVVEFVMDLGTQPITGFAADDASVYCVLGVQSGTAATQRVAVYKLPRPIVIQDNPKSVQLDPNGKPIRDPRATNPVDNLINRYPPETSAPANTETIAGSIRRSKPVDAPVGGMSGSRTPSLASLPRVTPPYTLDTDLNTDSINLLPSLRQPYRLRSDFQRDTQQSASIGTIPPSLAAALALSDLRPKNIQPALRWEYGFTSRVLYPVTLTPLRVWSITDDRGLIALSKLDKKLESSQILDDPISAPPGRGGVLMYLPLGTGYLLAIDGTSGTRGGGANVLWRATVGGICNRTPFVTDAMVYAQ